MIIGRFLYLHPIAKPLTRRLAARARERAEKKDRWGEKAGFLYDLEHRLWEHDALFVPHYDFTLRALKEVASEAHTIVDYGCGPGVLTEEIARLYPKAKVIGTDLRESPTLNLNRKLAPHIEWIPLAQFDPIRAVYVIDGVVNYMDEKTLRRIVERAEATVCFYAYTEDPMKPQGVSFSMDDVCRDLEITIVHTSDVHATAVIRHPDWRSSQST